MKLKDKKIRIIAFTSTTNEHGFNTEEWRPIHSGRLWAYYRQLSGSEFYASAMVNAAEEVEGFRVLEESTDAAERQRAAFIAAALNTLPQQEQEILRQFFIDRRCRYAGHRAKLQAMYGLSLSELYRQKNEAITNYCMAALAIRAAMSRKRE